MIEAHVPAVQKVLERSWYFWNQNIGHIILVGVHVPKGILHESDVIGIGHVVFGLGHQVSGIGSTFQVELDDPALLGHLTGRHDYPILVPNWELKMSGARLEEVVNPHETLMVPIGLGIVLYEIKVHTVGKGPRISVSVCPIYIQICASLSVVNLGPVTGNASDVIFF